MSDQNKTASRLLTVGFFVVVALIIAAAILLTVMFAGRDSKVVVPQPTAELLITSMPAIITPTQRTLSTVTPFPTGTPTHMAVGLLTPIYIVGDDTDNPSDGLLVRTGPGYECSEEIPYCNLAYNDFNELRKVYVDDVFPVYGVDDTEEWCQIDEQGSEWVSCLYTKPALPDDCGITIELSPYIQECEEDG